MPDKKSKPYTKQEEQLLDTFFTWYGFVCSGIDKGLDNLSRSISATDDVNVFCGVLDDIEQHFGAEYAEKLEEALDLLSMRSFIMDFQAAYEVDLMRR